MLTAIIDPHYNMVSLLATMGSLAARDAGWPQGGSLAFALGVEKRYLELGGTIHYNSRVNEILVENHRAIGIRLAGGQEARADAVISAADGHTTLYSMLKGRYLPNKIARLYSGDYPTITSVLVFMGVDHDFSSVPHCMFPLEPPLQLGGRTYEHIGFNNYSFDPTMSPPGKSVVCAVFYADYAYWQELWLDREKYKAEKQLFARRVVDELERCFPDAAGKVEVTDVATPVTFNRYTGVWKGAYMS